MATYYARKNGNVNATDVWATTPTGVAGDYFSSFTNQDILVANNFTITLNVNTTVSIIINDTTGGATAGGSFTLNGGITLTANIYASTVVLNYSASGTSTIVGNIYSPTSTNTYSVGVAGSGTLNIIGNIYGGSSNSSGVSNNSATVNFTGNIYMSSGGNAYGIGLTGAGIINITGNIVGGSGGGNPPGTGASNSSASGTMTITGNVFGGTANGVPGALLYGAGTLIIIGTATGGVFGPGAINYLGTGTLIVTRAKGNGFGNGSVGLNSVVGVQAAQGGATKVYEIEYGALGQSPTSGPIELVNANSNVAVFAIRLSTPKTLVDLNNATNLIPASGNVRNGVSYNYGNNTGSCVIPNTNSVVYGVPVDNTVGSGLLSPVAVWNALTSSIGTSGTIGERLKNVSTVATVGKQLEGVL